MNKIELFEFEKNELRAFYLYGEIWFIAMDIADILGYIKTDKMLNLIQDKDKKTINPHSYKVLQNQFKSNTHKICIINESGLYRCIFNSTKPEALKFTDWVTSVVLPQIRQHGEFNVKQFTVPTDMIEALEELAKSLKAQNGLIKQNEILKTELKQNEPKIEFSNKVAIAVNCVSFLQLAKMLGISRKKLVNSLRDLKIIMKNSTLPYQKYVDKEIFVVKEKIFNTKDGTKVIPYTKITGKGQLYISERLQKHLKEVSIWHKVLNKLTKKTTRQLFKNECQILKIEHNTFIIGVKNSQKFSEVQSKYPELYNAIYELLNHKLFIIEFETITE